MSSRILPLFVFVATAIVLASSSDVQSCNCVVFRLDDLQDYWITASQRAVIDVFSADHTPLTVGIIANAFGNDQSIVSYVQNAMAIPDWKLEIANHGFNHEFFDDYTLDEQTELLSNALKSMHSVLPSLGNVEVFIPPYNEINANTIIAAKANNFTIMSSMTELDLPPYPYNVDFLRWPINASTNDMSVSYDVGVSSDATFAQIQTQLATYGFAVVMMHPQEFSDLDDSHSPQETVNATMIHNLVQLISDVRAAGINIVNFKDIQGIFQGVSNTIINPSTIKPIAVPSNITDTVAVNATVDATVPIATPTINETSPVAVNVNITVPAVNITTPDVNITIPAVNVTTTSVNITTPSVNVTTPDVNITVPTSAPVVVAPQAAGCANCVAFKLEQVQDFYQSAVSVAIMNEFKIANVPLTVGIIPNLFGLDASLKTIVTQALAQCSVWQMELAANGFKFEDFTKILAADQVTLLKQAKAKVQAVAGVAPTVFIPPFLAQNDDLLASLQATGFTSISGLASIDAAPYARSNVSVWHFPAGASFNGEDTPMQQITAQQTSQKFSVFMMNPQDFATVNGTVNTAMITTLRSLLDQVKTAGMQPMLISELAKSFGGPESTATCHVPRSNLMQQRRAVNANQEASVSPANTEFSSIVISVIVVLGCLIGLLV